MLFMYVSNPVVYATKQKLVKRTKSKEIDRATFGQIESVPRLVSVKFPYVSILEIVQRLYADPVTWYCIL